MVNDSVPEINIDHIDASAVFLSKTLNYPLIINAITGGTENARRINRSLAKLARQYGLAMAVGSQTMAIHEPILRDTFSVVRKENPDGLILANVSALSGVEQALEAVEMVEADGLQLHFNIPQELAMPEGDRDFAGMLENVARLVENSPVPIIAKEVGFGFSQEAARRLCGVGINYFDVVGKAAPILWPLKTGGRDGLFMNLTNGAYLRQ